MKNVKLFEAFVNEDNEVSVNEAKNKMKISFRFHDGDDAETFCDTYGIKHNGSNYAEGEVDVKLIADMVKDLTEVYGIKNLRAQ